MKISNKNMIHKVEISSKTIVFTVSFVLGIWFLYEIRNILVMLFIGFILMTAINPIVKITNKVKIPPLIAVLFTYSAIIALFSVVVASLLPALIQQTGSLISQLPNMINSIDIAYNIQLDGSFINENLSSVPSNILKFAAGAFSNIISLLAVFFMTYYLILERPNLHKYLTRFFGNNGSERKAEALVREIETRVGGWIRGEIILMLIIGLSTYTGLVLLNIPFALPLGILAGLLEIVPNIGPVIAAVPAVIIGLSVSPLAAIGVLALSILVQQLENNFIVPQVMKRAIGVRPLVTITVLFTGLTLGGIMGMILAMPLYIVASTIIKHTS